MIDVRHGDMLDVLRIAARAGEKWHACVTDPPYHLTSIQKRFGKEGSAPAQYGKDGAFARLSGGFMGKTWDGGDVAFRPETWRLVYDVLRPGAFLAAFGGTRTQHRMACAIEDAGFEIRENLLWLYATGFPKSHNVSKGVDKTLGTIGEVIPIGDPVARMIPGADQHKDGWAKTNGREYQPGEYIPGSPEAQAWDGYGTALKPAYEPIILARKPLDGTVAENALRHGCGGINIDGCRVGDEPTITRRSGGSGANGVYGKDDRVFNRTNPPGRWPPNILHDGSPEVLEAFGRFGDRPSGNVPAKRGAGGISTSGHSGQANVPNAGRIDNGGSVARFFPALGYSDAGLRMFYSSKAGKAERAGSKHPTVKPLALMRWLVKLVTPPGGRVLDPFAGTGTTLAAARDNGFDATGIEMTDEYVTDILRRLRPGNVALNRGPWGADLPSTLARARIAWEIGNDEMVPF